jgi:predicted RNA-binding Zn-ribbon protein involved in translation (DUF1610 family)
MEKRICPNCGQPWHSASGRTWPCPNCGALVGRENKVKLDDNKDIIMPLKTMDKPV